MLLATVVQKGQGRPDMSIFSFPSKKKQEELELVQLKGKVDREVKSIKVEKKKKVLAQKAEFKNLNEIVAKYGVEGIYFFALGGIEERKS